MTNSNNATIGSSRPYFVKVVLPTYARFMEYYVGSEFGLGTDVRNANEVAEALLHLGDRVHQELGDCAGNFANATEFRRSLFKRCEAYAIVSDVGLVAKHNIINGGEGYLRSSDAISENIAIDRYKDSDGVYFRYRKLLEVRLREDRCADLGHLLFHCVKFWSLELVRLGVIPAPPVVAEPLPLFVPRSCQDRMRKFRSLGQVGEYMSNQHKVFFYRYDQGLLTPGGPSDKLGAEAKIEFVGDIRPSPFDPEDYSESP
jgi:hypothetical protein